MWRLPFTECHPPVVDPDGAIAQASHNERAVGVTGQTCHTAVGTRGNVLSPRKSGEEGGGASSWPHPLPSG